MTAKSTLGMLLLMAVGGAVYPIAAQQVPPTSQPNGTPTQPAPATPPTGPSQIKPVPRRIPTPAGAVGQQGAPSVVPPAQPGAAAAPVPTRPPAVAQQQGEAPTVPTPAPTTPPRRAFQSPGIPSAGMVSLNFNRADLVEIIHIIAQQLRLTYTIDPEVKGTVTINSAEPLRPEDLLPIFHQLLRMNGAVAVRTGNLYHIMPIKDGKGLARPLGQSKEDSFALQIIPVRFFSVAEMKKVLMPFLQPGAEIVENPRGNFLIVMDLPSNIARLNEIAEMIDVQVFAGTRMEIYQPKVASAEELSQEMTKVMQSFGASAPQADSYTAQFIPLPRINQLLVISHSEAAWTYARRWLERIDVVAEGPGRRIFIYAVENGKATELADVLNQALGQASTGSRPTGQTLQSIHRSTSPTPGNQPGGSGNPSSSFGSQGSSGQQSRPTGSSFAAIPLPGQVPAAPGGQAQQFQQPAGTPGVARPPVQGAGTPSQQEQLRIVADPATNSLIIYGTSQEFQNIKNILKDLDAIPRQVLIEAMILQVNYSDTENFGVDYEFFRGNRSIFDSAFGSRGALISGAIAAFLKEGGLRGSVGGGDTVRAFVTALLKDSRVKLVSSPSVLATDNRPARIQVGTEEPVPTGTISTPTGSTGISSSTTVQYRNTGRILTIIPQVNSQGLVNLQVKAEVSQRGESVSFGGGTSAETATTFPTFDTQDAETNAVVNDGETLVIGGLIGERKSKDRKGIPYLMDIPVVGRFFSTTSDETRRTELIMLITPRVIRNRDEGRIVTDNFKNNLAAVRNELERMERERAKLRPPPSLPPMPDPNLYYKDELPQPAPANAPVGPRTALPSNLANLSLPSNEFVGRSIVTSANAESARALPLESPTANPPSMPASQSLENYHQERLAAQPAYALSAVNRSMERPALAAVPKLIAPSAKTVAGRAWAVQVASLSELKEAENLAARLRKEGYDAYIVTADIAAKRWFRIRIGQSESLQQAVDLKNQLVSSKSFKDAFIAER